MSHALTDVPHHLGLHAPALVRVSVEGVACVPIFCCCFVVCVYLFFLVGWLVGGWLVDVLLVVGGEAAAVGVLGLMRIDRFDV